MRIGSLFSGIGGLELGLERAGLGPVVWQAESDPFCRQVLAKHWPEATRYEDVRDVNESTPRVDIICGGFPCQDLSDAATTRRLGLAGARSGLWSEFRRVVDTLRPRWALVENVDGAAWLRWVPVVRGDLHGIGYASLPVAVSAAAVGAPFSGSRVFILAKAHGDREPAGALHAEMAKLYAPPGTRGHWREPAPWHLGVDDGVPGGVDQRRALGNAVVPQVAEAVGGLICSLT
jgi:DNA (cytosine-5)-methyltransferase 1